MITKLSAVLRAKIVETHISWVLLTEERAYKIKKPLFTSFLDSRDLRSRLKFCNAELAVNQRLGKPIYIGVVPITGTTTAPTLGGKDKPIEYAVEMIRFPESSLLEASVASNQITKSAIDRLADRLGIFHVEAPPAPPGSSWGSPDLRALAARRVLNELRNYVSASDYRSLRHWLLLAHRQLHELWRTRRLAGHVRECHGDLHLGNLIDWNGVSMAFDAIEFSDELRWIDVIDDIAFPVMDLEARGRPDLAFRLLSRWLDVTGEHEGLPCLRHSVVQRCLVRAMAMCMKNPQAPESWRFYVRCAFAWVHGSGPKLTVMHGLPGSGKTSASQVILESQRAVRLRSDVERKRLAGLRASHSSSESGIDIYTQEMDELTYGRLFTLARDILKSGHSVVIDACFLRRKDRHAARGVALESGAEFSIVCCDAPMPQLLERVSRRSGDASEARPELLAQMAKRVQPLGGWELAYCRPATGSR